MLMVLEVNIILTFFYYFRFYMILKTSFKSSSTISIKALSKSIQQLKSSTHLTLFYIRNSSTHTAPHIIKLRILSDARSKTNRNFYNRFKNFDFYFGLVAPQISHFDFGEETVNSGDSASLHCSLHKGDLPVKLSWLLNNRTISPDDGILMSKVGKKMITLSIDSVQEHHAGVYTCLAKNQAGTARYSADLHVNGDFSK